MPILEHLAELRSRLIRVCLAAAPALLLAWLAAPHVIHLLTRPFDELNEQWRRRELRLVVDAEGLVRAEGLEALARSGAKLDRIAFVSAADPATELLWLGTTPSGIIYSTPAGPFTTTMNVSLILALVFVFPYVLGELWGFISPGLLETERRWGGPFVVAGAALFAFGAAFAYFSLKFALIFFSGFIQEGAFYYNDMTRYLGFVLLTMAAFGALFQLPLATLLAVRLGLVRRSWLAERRRYVFIALLVVAAVVTPTQDAFTLALMAGPLYVLFEISLALSRLVERPDPAGEAFAALDSSA
ncbi:MAG: twin-arginine translocase subunit TatC [Candidatus Sumerlaeia bacterium]|nr:twin-arginine translocase subunit TatC [Candidatus Sumerlaeia bacterium]